ncbi:MAG: efflux RND transporter periplasmic adaptor subunit [Planctomycetota bacterium]
MAARGRHRWPALLVAGLLIGGCIATFIVVTADRWLPARAVRAVRVVSLETGEVAAVVEQAEPTVAFQAAGWLEGDPYAVHATALVGGVVESVAVLEGETVEAGQVLARLDDTDHRLALARSEAAVAEAQAAVQVAEASEAMVAARKPALRGRIAAATARRAVAVDLADRLEAGADAVPEADLVAARLQSEAAAGELAALEAELAALDTQLAQAAAQVAAARARVASAEVARDVAQLDLERCTITAPVDGIVQQLYAFPGRKQLLQADAPTSSTVASIVDPERLQVRVDVALADAAGLYVGQRSRISVEALPDRTFSGTVTRIVGEADVTRNTLQAKVALDDPVSLLRPEMLARVQFLARQTPADEATVGGTGALQVYVPPAALQERNDNRASCWALVEDASRVEPRTLELGGQRAGWVAVRDGLRPGEAVVVDPPADLQPGDRVEPQWQEATP